MVTLPIRYPLDPTGVNPDNKVVGEIHDLPARKVRAVAPGYGSFFAESVVVRDSATGLALQKNVQFVCTEMLEFPTGRYGKEVDGIILIKDETVSSRIEIDYQTLGGEYSTNSDAIISMLNSAEMDNRPVAWGDVIGKPDVFTPAKHYHDVGDIYGFEYVVHAIERVREAILIGDDASHDQIYRYIDASFNQLNTHLTTVESNLNAHVADLTNPHQTTKAQVGLGLVDNFATATTQQAQTGTATNLFMTPALSAAAINTQAGALLTTHINDHNNPHQTTKAQVGLGVVDNFPTSTQDQAQTGTDNASFMTPLRVAQAVSTQAGALLTKHINDHTNPHAVTAAQVGLGSVSNYATAIQSDAEAGTSNSLFMTPLRVSQAITALIGNSFTAHVNNFNNPHQTTKAQVGLGSVQNYPVASTAQAQAGTDNATYMTPLLTAQAVTQQVGNTFSAHVNNLSNPHQVTKAQVGLGNVDNFLTATDAEAQASTRTDRFMTPRGVSLAINNVGASLVNAHASRTDNPHQTTASQVGLSNVQNYPIATNAQALDGNNTSSYMTPATSNYLVNNTVSSYAPSKTGSGASGTWGINVTGSSSYANTAGGVDWSNVSNRPTAVSTFTNDSGYLTASTNRSTAQANFTGAQTTGIGTSTGGLGAIMVQGDGSNAAFMSFHRPGSFAAYFGIDTDNQWAVGGWSMGANRYVLLHAGNYNSYSPTLTGGGASGNWTINITGTAAVANTANSVAWANVSGRPTSLSSFTNDPGYITGSGSVAYAATAGSANSVAWTNVSSRPTAVSAFTNDAGYVNSSGSVAYATNAGSASSVAWANVLGRPTTLSAFTNDVGYTTPGGSYTWTTQTFNSANASVGVGGQSGTIFQSTGSSASISFLRPNAYGINFGLDSDNVIRLGGWSNGTNVYRMQIDTSGNATFPGNVSGFSDRSLKKDIETITDPLEKISKLEGVTFTRIDTGERQTGLIAQDVLEVLPEAVKAMKDGILSLAYGNLAGLFTECLKALMNEVQELKAEVKTLKESK